MLVLRLVMPYSNNEGPESWLSKLDFPTLGLMEEEDLLGDDPICDPLDCATIGGSRHRRRGEGQQQGIDRGEVSTSVLGQDR